MIDVEPIHRAAPRPLELARRLSFRIEARAHRDSVRVCCPWHNGKKFNCAIWLEDERIRAYCHTCKVAGDFLSLIAVANHLDARTDFRRVAELAADFVGIQLPEEPSPHRAAKPQRPSTERLAMRIEYWADRWLAGKTIDKSLRKPDEPRWVDPIIDNATPLQITEAFELLSIADQMDRDAAFDADAKLDAMADDVLARIAARETLEGML